jgi:hypothetical protein
LVLVAVDSLVQLNSVVSPNEAGIMAGCDAATAQSMRVFPEYTEFDFTIAQNVRIRRTAGAVLAQEIFEYKVPVFCREVDVMQWYLQHLAYVPGFLKVFGRRTVSVIVFPVCHVQGVHVGALLLEQQSRYGRVDAAG